MTVKCGTFIFQRANMTISVHDMLYFVSYDAEGNVIRTHREICFGVMNRNPRQYLLNATKLDIYMGCYSSRASIAEFTRLMFESGLADKEWCNISTSKTLPLKMGKSGIHKNLKRFICLSFDPTKVSLQRMYIILNVVRVLQNEPYIGYYVRKFAHIPMDFMQRVAVMNALGNLAKNNRLRPKAFYGHIGGYHIYGSMYALKVNNLTKEMCKIVDEKYPLPAVMQDNYDFRLLGYNYTSFIYSSSDVKLLQITRVTEEVVLSLLKQLGVKI